MKAPDSLQDAVQLGDGSSAARADAAAVGRSDSDAARTFGRHVAIAAIVAVVTALVAGFVLGQSDDEYRARARIVLADEVRWSFHDSVRQTQINEVRDGDVLAVVENSIGARVRSLEVSLVKAQAFFDVEVVADSPTVAADAANAAAAVLIERDFAAVVAPLDAEIAATAEAFATIGPGDDVETATERGTVASMLQSRQLERAAAVGNIELLDAAVPPDSPTSNPIRDGIIIGLLAGFLALGAQRLMWGLWGRR